jgi:hypothetical protein
MVHSSIYCVHFSVCLIQMQVDAFSLIITVIKESNTKSLKNLYYCSTTPFQLLYVLYQLLALYLAVTCLGDI